MTNKLCQVALAERIVDCPLPKSVLTQKNSLVVGDRVTIVEENQGVEGTIVDILPRETALHRGNRRSLGQEILVAANVQYLLVVVAADYLLNQAGYCESALITAKRSGIGIGLFISKWDLIGEAAQASLKDKLSLYAGLANSVLVGSALEVSADLVETVRGKTTVLIGDRGNGKSTVIQGVLNSLQQLPASPRTVQSTLTSQMCFGPGETILIDTPGFRELALHGITEAERDFVFPEIAGLSGECIVDNCTHVHEQGCQVIEMLRQGQIKRERYEVYLEMAGAPAKASKRDRTETKTILQHDYRHKACTESFSCKKCGELVTFDGAGTDHRNHCPRCLTSVHVDNHPGDRSSLCHGMMEPVSVWVRKNGEWAIIHRCNECGTLSSNRIAADDNAMLLMSLAVRPLSMPPFPLHTLPTA